MKYTANYLCRAAEIVCSVLHKWHLCFYLIPHSDFGFFSCVGYLHPKDYIKSVKNPFLNLELNSLYHALTFLITVALKGVQLIIKIWEFLALGDSLGHIQVLHKVLAPYKAFKDPYKV